MIENANSIELSADEFISSSRVIDLMYKADELVHSFKLKTCTITLCI